MRIPKRAEHALIEAAYLIKEAVGLTHNEFDTIEILYEIEKQVGLIQGRSYKSVEKPQAEAIQDALLENFDPCADRTVRMTCAQLAAELGVPCDQSTYTMVGKAVRRLYQAEPRRSNGKQYFFMPIKKSK